MGWSIYFTSKTKNFLETDIQKIVNALPKKYKGYSEENQGWGWSTRVDIFNPEGNEIRIGGAYGLSGDVASAFATYFKKELNVLGYDVSRKSCW